MFLYLLSTAVGVMSAYFMYKIDAPKVIKENVSYRYKKWKKLRGMVSTTEKSNFRITLVSIQLIMRALYVALLQYLNNSVRKLDRKTYEFTYVMEGKLYRMIATVRRGPTPILQIIDDQDNDVTDKVLPYMGPQYDWHGCKLTPQFFGHKSLTFELMDGNEHTYTGESFVDYTPRSRNKIN